MKLELVKREGTADFLRPLCRVHGCTNLHRGWVGKNEKRKHKLLFCGLHAGMRGQMTKEMFLGLHAEGKTVRVIGQ